MAWTFVTVGKQATQDQARLADVGEQLVLSQRVAKYALAATTGDADAFNKMEVIKERVHEDSECTDVRLTGIVPGKTNLRRAWR